MTYKHIYLCCLIKATCTLPILSADNHNDGIFEKDRHLAGCVDAVTGRLSTSVPIYSYGHENMINWNANIYLDEKTGDIILDHTFDPYDMSLSASKKMIEFNDWDTFAEVQLIRDTALDFKVFRTFTDDFSNVTNKVPNNSTGVISAQTDLSRVAAVINDKMIAITRPNNRVVQYQRLSPVCERIRKSHSEHDGHHVVFNYDKDCLSKIVFENNDSTQYHTIEHDPNNENHFLINGKRNVTLTNTSVKGNGLCDVALKQLENAIIKYENGKAMLKFSVVKTNVKGFNNFVHKISLPDDTPSSTKWLYRIEPEFKHKYSDTKQWYSEDMKTNFHMFTGRTRVINEAGAISIYALNKTGFLKSIHHYKSNDDLQKGIGFYHSKVTYKWDQNRIKEITTYDHGDSIYEKKFDYDANGNVKTAIQVIALNGGQNSELKTSYEYNDDNLCINEAYEDKLWTDMEYDPISKKLVSKRVRDKSGIIQRQYFEYDMFGTCTMMIQDDGVSLSKDNIEGVCYRWVTRQSSHQDGPGVGLVKEKQHAYLDFDANIIKQLSKETYQYDEFGNVISTCIFDTNDQLMYTLSYVYDDNGHVVSEINANGVQIDREYDRYGNVTKEVFVGRDKSIEYGYDSRNQLKKRTVMSDGVSKWISYDYDANGNVIKQKNHLGHQKQFEFNALNQCVRVMHEPVVDASTGVLNIPTYEYEYDVLGNVIKEKKPSGAITESIYNGISLPIKHTYHDGTYELFTYNDDGVLTKQVFRDGTSEEYEYDVLSRMIKRVFKDNNGVVIDNEVLEHDRFFKKKQVLNDDETEYGYDNAGRLISEVQYDKSDDKIVSYGYDSYGNINKEVTSTSNEDSVITTHYQFDVFGNCIHQFSELPSGKKIESINCEFDDDNNLIKKEVLCSENDRSTWEYEYDGFGNITLERNPMGIEKQSLYRSVGLNGGGYMVEEREDILPSYRRKALIDSYGHVIKLVIFDNDSICVKDVEYRYNVTGNCVGENERVLDVNTNVTNRYITEKKYDLDGNMIAYQCHEPTKSWINRYRYDVNNNIQSMRLNDGVTISYKRDVRGNMISRMSSDDSIHDTFQYNHRGDLISAKNECTGQVVDRDLNRWSYILSEDDSQSIVDCDRDALGRLLSIDKNDVGVTNYGYDGLLLKKMCREPINHKPFEITFDEYDSRGLLLAQSVEDGNFTVHYKYNAMGMKSSVCSGIFYQKVVSYDPMGYIKKVEAKQGRKFHDGYFDVEYKYDALGQLIEEEKILDYLNDYIPLHNQYDYDSFMNRVSVSSNRHNGSSEEPTDVEYDDRGNLTQYTHEGYIVSCRYDALNRLVGLKRDGFNREYIYDALGRRFITKKQTIGFWGSETNNTIYHSYMGGLEVGQRDENTIIHRTLDPTKPSEKGATLSIEHGNSAYYVIGDLYGSISNLFFKSHSQIAYVQNCMLYYQSVENKLYSAFGDVIKGLSAGISPWGYHGKRFDSDFGLVDFGLRHYNIKLGSWLTHDPKGDVDSTNMYQFNHNNPINFFDLFGAESMTLTEYNEKIEAEPNPFDDMLSNVISINDFQHQYIGRPIEIPCLCEYKKEGVDGCVVGYINGVRGDFESHIEQVKAVAEVLNTNVISVYNPSYSLNRIASVFGKINIDKNMYSQSSGELLSVIQVAQRMFGELKVQSPEEQLVITHSEGQVVLKGALMSADKPMSNPSLVVHSYGGITTLNGVPGIKSYVNHVYQFDLGVHLFASPERGADATMGNYVRLPAHKNDRFKMRHSLLSDTYLLGLKNNSYKQVGGRHNE
ncbi:hypothetical protein N9N03_00030 [Chlamydiia bacterium]|nr:hypothetical protein [Chlamydiia bacterium]